MDFIYSALKVRSSTPLPKGAQQFGTRIRELRRNRGDSLRKVAQATGISKSTLLRLESGEACGPRLAVAKRLAHYFGCPIEELL